MLVYKEIIASVVILASGETVLVDNSCINVYLWCFQSILHIAL